MSVETTWLVLLANSASTGFLVGLIWFVQIVHYPQFQRVGVDAYSRYQAAHVRLTTWVVGPPMLIEGITSTILLWAPVSGMISAGCWAGFLLSILIWISTAVLQVPCHNKLARGFDADAHRTLVRSNWIRTIAWTARGLLMLYLLHAMFIRGVENV